MIGDPYLTGTSRSHRDTVAGMAHFAGTGPVGSHCTDTKYTRGCRFYDKERCIKYRELSAPRSPATRRHASTTKNTPRTAR